MMSTPSSASAFATRSFFWLRHAAAGRLLAVAQRRVEDEDAVGVRPRHLDDGTVQAKFAASFTSPEPRYCAI